MSLFDFLFGEEVGWVIGHVPLFSTDGKRIHGWWVGVRESVHPLVSVDELVRFSFRLGGRLGHEAWENPKG
jgi:hypothetical protein